MDTLLLLLMSSSSHVKIARNILACTFHKRFIWKIHILQKQQELKFRFRQFFRLFRSRNHLGLENMRLLYVTVLQPLWNYGLSIWGYTADSSPLWPFYYVTILPTFACIMTYNLKL